MTSRQAVRWLLAAAVGLPLLEGLLSWVAGLLREMGDQGVAAVLYRCGLAGGILWLFVLAALVIALAIRSLEHDHPPHE